MNLIKSVALTVSLTLSSISFGYEGFYQEELTAPDGWFIASANPCDCLISMQNLRRPNVNFTYAYFREIETNTTESIARQLIKQLNCLNPVINKNEIGAQVIQCDSDLNIDVWEVDLDNPDITLYAAMVSANIPRSVLSAEMQKLLQVALQYQNFSLDYHKTDSCNIDRNISESGVQDSD